MGTPHNSCIRNYVTQARFHLVEQLLDRLLEQLNAKQEVFHQNLQREIIHALTSLRKSRLRRRKRDFQKIVNAERKKKRLSQ
ncbi:hypothetical protein SLA2020_501070 [Shorea laevis]